LRSDKTIPSRYFSFFNVAQASEISAVAAPQEIEMVEKARPKRARI